MATAEVTATPLIVTAPVIDEPVNAGSAVRGRAARILKCLMLPGGTGPYGRGRFYRDIAYIGPYSHIIDPAPDLGYQCAGYREIPGCRKVVIPVT